MQRSSFPSSVQASLADFGQQFCYCILQPKGNWDKWRGNGGTDLATTPKGRSNGRHGHKKGTEAGETPRS